MRTNKMGKLHKTDNKGFSLLELIVTIAIMIVVVAVVFASSTMVGTSYIKDAERGIKDYVSLARSKSMSVAAKSWYAEFENDQGSYVARVCKIVEDGDDDKEVIIDEKELGKELTMSFGDNTVMTTIATGESLRFYFDASTGKVKEVLLQDISQSMSGGIGYIEIVSGSYDATLKVFYNTGKCERE